MTVGELVSLLLARDQTSEVILGYETCAFTGVKEVITLSDNTVMIEGLS